MLRVIFLLKIEEDRSGLEYGEVAIVRVDERRNTTVGVDLEEPADEGRGQGMVMSVEPTSLSYSRQLTPSFVRCPSMQWSGTRSRTCLGRPL